ncbi:hypothetical protein Tco_1065331 [Tanacetum coccineum]
MAEQDTPPPTITAMKIHIIKKGEYDIWSMRMRQYICHTDHNLLDIIVNGDLQEEPAPTGDQSGLSAPHVPKTTKQLAAKRNQERAIKSRFGGNEESKKMQKNVLKHQIENFTTAPNESLDKAYDRFQKLISQLEVHVAPISKEDINQKVYEDEIKRSSSSTSNSHNLAFLSSENTSRTNEVSTASRDFKTTSPQLKNEDLQQIEEDDLEELDLRWQVAMLIVRVKKFIQKIGRNLDFKGKQSGKQHVTFDKSQVECYNCHKKGRNATTNEPSSQALVAQGGYDWSNDFDEPVNYDLMAISSSSSSSSSDNEVRSSDEEITPANDRFSKADGYHDVPPRANISFAGVLTRTGLVNPVRTNGKRAVHTVSTTRPISTTRLVSTARPFAPKIAQNGSAIRPIYPRMDNVRPRASYSPIKRSYYTKPAFRPKNLKQDVKTSGAVVNTGNGKMDNALKKSRWVWRPKGNYIDHESKEK